MTPTFMSDQFDAMYYVPSYRAWFFRQDLRPAYQYHRRFLQHLQFRHATHRWILKAPTHMFAIPALLSVLSGCAVRADSPDAGRCDGFRFRAL